MVTIKKVSGSTPTTTKAFVDFCGWCDSNLQLSVQQRFSLDAAESLLCQTHRGEGRKALFERWGKYKEPWKRTSCRNQRVYNAKSQGLRLLLVLLEDYGKEAGLSPFRIEKIRKLMNR